MNVRYRVELSQTERSELKALLSGGKQAARKLKRRHGLSHRRYKGDAGMKRWRSLASSPKTSSILATPWKSSHTPSKKTAGRPAVTAKTIYFAPESR
jgi:hypothetical protein